MGMFTYEALDAAGNSRKGQIEAGNKEEAASKIKSQGFFPTNVREQKVKGKAQDGQPRALKKKKKGELTISIGGVNTKTLTTFTRQLSTLQDAGLSLLRSLQVLEQQQRPGLMKNIIAGVAEDVEGGSTLSDAMAKQPKAFDRLYVKMVNAGEIGGVLDLILNRLADFLEKAQRLRRKIIGAMIYPAVVISVAVSIVSAIMVFVIPKFQEIFEDFEITLPGLTLWLIDTSKWMAGNRTEDQTIPGAIWVLITPFVLFFFIKLLRKTEPGRAVVDWTKMHLPLVGTLIRKSSVARFTRTLGTLISAGVPILEAILITRDTSGNWVFERALNKVHDSIREGESFAQPLRETKVVEPIVVNMIDVGEETGDLDAMLLKVADNYDEEVDVAVSSLVSLLEPLMVVVLGGIVGTIVVALFMPMVKMIESVSQQ
ncbi:MAG: type II secretion system F family protein [Planctomycetes bacterium]|nr:type II secretion system F family protein [Planctomycetota bacterium]NOG53834.1 type II secretion system F family protein [Planctomycetota bacterium]